MKSYAGKWRVLGLTNKQRIQLYWNTRMKAMTKLKNKHKKEYFVILKGLIDEELRRLKKLK